MPRRTTMYRYGITWGGKWHLADKGEYHALCGIVIENHIDSQPANLSTDIDNPLVCAKCRRALSN